MMPTPEQHAALAKEIIDEMTPEELAKALRPIDLDAELRCVPIRTEGESQKLDLDIFYSPVIRNPFRKM